MRRSSGAQPQVIGPVAEEADTGQPAADHVGFHVRIRVPGRDGPVPILFGCVCKPQRPSRGGAVCDFARLPVV